MNPLFPAIIAVATALFSLAPAQGTEALRHSAENAFALVKMRVARTGADESSALIPDASHTHARFDLAAHQPGTGLPALWSHGAYRQIPDRDYYSLALGSDGRPLGALAVGGALMHEITESQDRSESAQGLAYVSLDWSNTVSTTFFAGSGLRQTASDGAEIRRSMWGGSAQWQPGGDTWGATLSADAWGAVAETASMGNSRLEAFGLDAKIIRYIGDVSGGAALSYDLDSMASLEESRDRRNLATSLSLEWKPEGFMMTQFEVTRYLGGPDSTEARFDLRFRF